MRDVSPPSPAVIVSVDGSRRTLGAALWAVDEAIARDVPLRMLYVVEPRDTAARDGRDTAHDFAVAESAVRHAAMAIESMNRPVKIEVEIVQGHLLPALLAASSSAALLCVDAVNLGEATGSHRGTAVTDLVKDSRCLVAIINGDGAALRSGVIVTEFNDSGDCPMVLGIAFEEARLRNVPLRVVTGWRPRFSDIHGSHATAQGNRDAKDGLERALRRYRRRYPEVDVEAAAVTGSPTNYLAKHPGAVSLIVLGHDAANQLTELGDPGIHAVCADLNCSMLIAPRHGAW